MMEGEYTARQRAYATGDHSKDANYAGPRDGYHPTPEKPMTPDTPKPPAPKHGDLNKERTLRYCGHCKRWTPAVYASCYGDDCMAPFPEEPTRWNSQ